MTTNEIRSVVRSTSELPEAELDSLRAGRELHMDHYRGERLPFASLGGHGLRQRLTELEGERAGAVFEVIDASGGYASASLGAGHDVVRDAFLKAGDCANYSTDEIAAHERSRLLTYLLGPGGVWTDHFPAGEYHVAGRNSGSEANELAIRLVLEARLAAMRTPGPGDRRAGRSRIVAFEGAWHGWTSGLVHLLNRRHYRVGLPQFAAAGPDGLIVDHLPYGDTGALHSYFAEHGHDLLAVVVEPVQTNAGILLPPTGYLRELAGLCTRGGALLVADEVVTFAKTGRFFAMADEHGPIPTDITVVAKSLGMGAVPAAMVIARRELRVRHSGAIASYDLRPLTCAVIGEGIRHIAESGLLEHSARLGEHLSGLVRKHLVDAFPQVYLEHRGRGVMHGIELTERAANRLGDLRARVIRAGVFVEFLMGAGHRSLGLRYLHPAMRLTPALVMTFAEADEVVRRIAAATAEFAMESL